MKSLFLLLFVSFVDCYQDISSELSSVRTTYDGLSLLGYSVNGQGNFCSLGSDGYRISGSVDSVVKTSRWHVGSCTKSMTATLFAILMEKGELGTNINWATELVQVLPEARNTPYERVRLQQLLGMQSCIPANPSNWFAYANGSSLSDQRRAATLDALLSIPTNPVGTADCYSNWAYVVAGHILEAATGKLWEELLVQELFEPLGIELDEVSFGPPTGSKDPWGHTGATRALVPCDPSSNEVVCDNPAVMGPAGTFSGTTNAMATYLAWHVACHNNAQDTASILSPSQCRKLHTPVNSLISSYALGWVCEDRKWAGNELACTHLGSNTLWTYNMWIAPGIDRAYVGATNTARDYYGEPNKDFTMTDATIATLISNQVDCPAPAPPTLGCFPETGVVHVKGKGSIDMTHLQIGDEVQVDDKGTYEPVYSFGHRDSISQGTFIRLTCEQDKNFLELTHSHMVFVERQGRHHAVVASNIVVGDTLIANRDKIMVVDSIQHVVRTGAYAPFTPSGKIVVNGIVASTYVGFWTANPLSVSQQWLAHTFLFPLRFMCHYFGSCNTEAYTDNGISIRLGYSYRLAEWLFQQDSVTFAFSMSFLVCVLIIFALVEHMLLCIGV